VAILIIVALTFNEKFHQLSRYFELCAMAISLSDTLPFGSNNRLSNGSFMVSKLTHFKSFNDLVDCLFKLRRHFFKKT